MMQAAQYRIRSDEYRELAESARHEATKAFSEDDQIRWEQIAEEWEALAIVADERDQRRRT
ncbi:MAG TPA: hypothetical protein VGH62_01520 [Bradyrhizobium sp.]|jgi:hypothetical protein